jgi:hypothetical protein
LCASPFDRSNIANNSKFILPSASLFQQYLPNIIARIQSSQTGSSMPTADYAKGLFFDSRSEDRALIVLIGVVNAALRKGGAPNILEIGGHTLLFKIFRWLPRGLVMFILWRRFATLKK